MGDFINKITPDPLINLFAPETEQGKKAVLAYASLYAAIVIISIIIMIYKIIFSEGFKSKKKPKPVVSAPVASAPVASAPITPVPTPVASTPVPVASAPVVSVAEPSPIDLELKRRIEQDTKQDIEQKIRLSRIEMGAIPFNELTPEEIKLINDNAVYYRK
jgi:hypothetical protein